MAKYGFRNTTASNIGIGAWSIPANSSDIFYDSIKKKPYHTSAIYHDIQNNSTGVNYQLVNNNLIFVIDSVDQTDDAFYAFWASYVGYIVCPDTDTLLPGIADAVTPVANPLYYTTTLPVVVSNSTTATTLFPSPSALTPYAMTPGNITNMQADGLIRFNSLTDSVAFSIMLGSASLASFTVTGTDLTGGATATDYHWKLDTKIGAQAVPSTSSAVSFYGTFTIVTSTGVLNIDLFESAVLDTSVSQTLNMSAQWSAASSNNSITSSIASIMQYTFNGSVLSVPGNGSSQFNIRSTTGNTILPTDYCIQYIGLADVTFPIPQATGSQRYLRFIHGGPSSASLYLDVGTNGAKVQNDTVIQLQKYADADIVIVEICDSGANTWTIVG